MGFWDFLTGVNHAGDIPNANPPSSVGAGQGGGDPHGVEVESSDVDRTFAAGLASLTVGWLAVGVVDAELGHGLSVQRARGRGVAVPGHQRLRALGDAGVPDQRRQDRRPADLDGEPRPPDLLVVGRVRQTAVLGLAVCRRGVRHAGGLVLHRLPDALPRRPSVGVPRRGRGRCSSLPPGRHHRAGRDERDPAHPLQVDHRQRSWCGSALGRRREDADGRASWRSTSGRSRRPAAFRCGRSRPRRAWTTPRRKT